MRVIQPIYERFRRQLQDYGAIPVSKNWWYRRILWLLRRINCLLTCQGETIQAQVQVGTSESIIRYSDRFAKKTTVANLGAYTAVVYETHVMIGVVASGQEIELPVAGKLTLQAEAIGGITTLRVTTYRRCLCGDTESPYDADVITPTGGNLI